MGGTRRTQQVILIRIVLQISNNYKLFQAIISIYTGGLLYIIAAATANKQAIIIITDMVHRK